MELSVIIAFFAGLIADIFRAVLIPNSTEWLSRIIPFKRKQVNRDENLIILEVMEKLKGLGKDPSLAVNIHEDTQKFIKRLQFHQDAFVQTQAEFLDSTNMTQIEMNMEASRSAEAANSQVEGLLNTLMTSSRLEENEKKALSEAQKAWISYRKAQSDFEAMEFDGGSMQPLIYSSSMESISIERLGHLKETYETHLETRHSH